MSHTAWNVSLNGRRIDKVFYSPDMTADEVRRSLINHDGYDSGIKVTKERRPAARKRDPNASRMILTDARGRPIVRPVRSEFADPVDFIRATHAYNDRVSGMANQAFEKGFRGAMTKSRRDPSRRSHEMNEINIFFNDLKRVDKLPLADRKANARRFSEELHSPGGMEVIAERVGWLLDGNYGEGAQIKAMQVARSPRMNQAAYLVQTIAALEWLVPPAMTIAAWRTLSMAQRNKLDRLIKEEIKDALGSS